MIRRILFNPGAGKAVADYLLKRNLNGFNVRQLPVNEYFTQLTETEKSSEELFLESNKWDGTQISGTDLFAMYTSFCTEESLTRCHSVGSFTRKLMTSVRDRAITTVTIGKNHTRFWTKTG